MSRPKRLASAADSGGKKFNADLPYTPTPPCEVGGLCKFFDTCRVEQLACLDYVRYEINGSNERTGAEPNRFNMGMEALK